MHKGTREKTAENCGMDAVLSTRLLRSANADCVNATGYFFHPVSDEECLRAA